MFVFVLLATYGVTFARQLVRARLDLEHLVLFERNGELSLLLGRASSGKGRFRDAGGMWRRRRWGGTGCWRKWRRLGEYQALCHASLADRRSTRRTRLGRACPELQARCVEDVTARAHAHVRVGVETLDANDTFHLHFEFRWSCFECCWSMNSNNIQKCNTSVYVQAHTHTH